MVSTLVGAVFNIIFAPVLIFGLDGVLYSMPVSDVLTFLIAAVIILRTLRELSARGSVNDGE